MLFKFKYISKSCVLYISGGCNFDKQEIFITFCAEDEQTIYLSIYLSLLHKVCIYILLFIVLIIIIFYLCFLNQLLLISFYFILILNFTACIYL